MNQGNGMENQDSEPLFGDDVYRLLRDDSLLHRLGSNNFAALTEPSTTTASVSNPTVGQQTKPEDHQEGQQPVSEPIIKQERNLCTPEQSTPEQQLITQQQAVQLQQQVLKSEHNYQAQGGEGPSHQETYITVLNTNGELILVRSAQQQPLLNAQLPQEQCQQPQTTASWDDVDMENEDSMQSTSNPTPIPTTLLSNPNNNSFMNLLDEYSSSAATPDTTTWTTPSLQPWAGKHNFRASIPSDNKDRNKWCFDQDLKKLYVCPNVAVPVNIGMSSWVNAMITITPVFQQSQFRNDAVNRCYNCKSIQSCDPSLIEYIVQVDGEGCIYETIQDRPIVKVPLPHPPPGESSSTLLVKLMCLTSCVGGPNRRPFCLVLTLHCNLTGSVIGRQVLDVKCCKCPSRDMNNDLRSASKAVAPMRNQPDEGQVGKIRKLSSQIHVNTKKKKPKVKPEPGTGTRYVNIAVPVEFELQVKSYVNGLIAESIVRRNHPSLLLYPDNDN